MKKVLILAYDFPPYVSVGGMRPYSWLKYLKEFDVEPIVVTRQFSTSFGDARDYVAASASAIAIIEETAQGTVIRSPYKPNFANRLFLKFGDSKFRLIRKIYSAFFEVAQYFWVCGPKKELYKAADAYLSANKVDAIIATGDPFVLFSFASKLSKKHKVEWIADYRDLWSQDVHVTTFPFVKSWLKGIEKRIVKQAYSIITVSHFLELSLRAYFPQKAIQLLPNGFDDENLALANEEQQVSSNLTIAFTGSIYNWHPLQSVLNAFSNVCNTSEQTITLHLYGINREEEVKQLIAQFPRKVQNSIVIHKRMQNQALLKKLAAANALLLFNDYAIMGTKIYDYLGVQRKIMFCYSKDEKALQLKEKYFTFELNDLVNETLQIEAINKTNAGIVVEDEAHLHTVLWDLLDEFKATGQIACNSHGIENYSRKIQVKKLAELIKNLK